MNPFPGVFVELAMAPSQQKGPRMVLSDDLTPGQVLDKYAGSVGMSEASLAEAHAALQVHERVVLVIDSTHSSGMYV
jgi:hypothetical protein